MLFVSACGKQPADEIHATSASNIEISSSAAETESSKDILIEHPEQTEKSTSEKDDITSATNQTTENTFLQSADEKPPYILSVTLNDLKQIKAAVESMDEAGFAEYMDKNFANEAMSGMNSIMNTKSILAELENSYFIFIDELDETGTIYFYVESHFISQDIEILDGVYFRSRIYTDSRKNFEYKNCDTVKHLKTLKNNDVTIELFENIEDEKEGLYGNIIENGQSIPFFTSVKITVDEIESALQGISIMKIGDLINS